MQHGGTHRDDSRILRLSIEKREPIEGGKTTMRIRNL